MAVDSHCCYCGIAVRYFDLADHSVTPPDFATIDHVNSLNMSKPRPARGETVLACYECNQRRAACEQKGVAFTVLP
jgi:hypothetical protein